MAKTKRKTSSEHCQGNVDVFDWLADGKLALLEGWARDGYTFQDIANCIGISSRLLSNWRKKYSEIEEALAKGRDEVDYLVENSLLKAALGYETQESKVTTVIQHGEVVETVKETLTKEQSPNVSAIQCWLYNRRPGKWRNMNSKNNIIDELDADTSIEIKVTRANDSKEETENENEKSKTKLENVNSSVTISKKSEETKRKSAKTIQTKSVEPQKDLDYWPDDWSEDEDN